MAIEKISPQMQDKIKRKSAYSLPQRPSEEQLGAERIKQAFYTFVTDDENSVLSEINRIVDQTNAALEGHNESLVHKNTEKSETDNAYVQLRDGTDTVMKLTEELSENEPSVMMRDADGRTKVNDPQDDLHAANKKYVDEHTTDSITPITEELEAHKERIIAAEDSIGAYTENGDVRYPSLSTDNSAIIPAINELLEMVRGLLSTVDKKANATDTATGGNFTHDGSMVVEANIKSGSLETGGVTAGNVVAENVTASEFTGNVQAQTVNTVNLNVTGTATVKHQEEVAVKDSVLVLNADGEDISGTYSGIIIRSSGAQAYAILLDVGTQSVKLGYGTYDEDAKTFTFGIGDDGAILTRDDSVYMTDGNLLFWDAEAHRARSSVFDETVAGMLYNAICNIGLDEYQGRYLSVVDGELQFVSPGTLVSVSSVEQTTTSSTDGGVNVVTVTLTDGTKSTVRIKNGSKGDKGDTGAQGIQGIQGEKGDTGEKGEKGDKGDTGEVSQAYAHLNFSNALKGSVSGEAVTISDVSPLEHEMSVRVSEVNNPEAVTVYSCGKNILDLADVDFEGSDGSKCQISNGSHVKLYVPAGVTNPLYNTQFGFTEIWKMYLPAGSYYLLSKNVVTSSSINGSASFVMQNAESSKQIAFVTMKYNNSDNAGMITIDEGQEVQFLLFSYVDDVGYTVESDIMLLPAAWYGGSTALTEYAKGVATIAHSVNLDSTVSGVTSLYPYTTLMTDTPGALIECEYNRDINKAFEEITQAIISMGGNV